MLQNLRHGDGGLLVTLVDRILTSLSGHCSQRVWRQSPVSRIRLARMPRSHELREVVANPPRLLRKLQRQRTRRHLWCHSHQNLQSENTENRMKAVVVLEPGKAVLADIPEPSNGSGETLLQV